MATALLPGLSCFGIPLGDAFQMRDDVIGAFGDTSVTGKPVGDDLREGKPTSLLARAVALAEPAERDVLARVGAVPRLGDDEVAKIQQVIIDTGALDELEARISTLAAEAVAALDRVAIEAAAREELRALAAFVVARVESSAMRVVVVGAGLGGLSAAAHLVGAGHDVTVVERGDRPGGRAGVIERDGFRLDNGPTVMTMPGLLADTFAAAGAELADHVELRPVDPMYRAVFADGSVLHVRHGREAMTEEIRAFAGGDAAASFGRFADWLDRAVPGRDAELHRRRLRLGARPRAPLAGRPAPRPARRLRQARPQGGVVLRRRAPAARSSGSRRCTPASRPTRPSPCTR